MNFIQWLIGKGYDAHAYPPKESTEFVTVERTGGGVTDLVDHPQITIQTWATDQLRASDMADEIRLALQLGDKPFGIYRADVNSGPYPFYDEETMMPRYQCVYDCTAQLIE